MPHLDIEDIGPSKHYYASTKNPEMSILIQNHGIGPAKLKSLEVRVDGRKELYHDINKLTLDTGIDYRFMAWKTWSDEYIKEGSEFTIYRIKDLDDLMARKPKDRLEALKTIATTMKKFHIIIRYESIYGDPGEARWQ